MFTEEEELSQKRIKEEGRAKTVHKPQGTDSEKGHRPTVCICSLLVLWSVYIHKPMLCAET